MEYTKVLEDVKKWAYEVGKIQINKLNTDIKYSSKSTKVDMVTEVDLLSEKMIIENITKSYPKHGILSEEKGWINSESEYTWIIDPLDGTNNYLHGFPIFAVSIALKKKGDTVLGLVYVPKLNETFYAVKGMGAFLNGEKIQVSDKDKLHKCIVSTGFPYDKKISKHNNVNLFTNIVTELQGIRRTGSAAFDLCSVACGRIDGYWELKLGLWDIAAAKLIIEEAGGKTFTSKLEKENGEQGINIVGGNEKVSKLLLEKINSIYKYF